MSQSKNWMMFVALGLIWGSSFLWIKLALQEIDPFAVVGWRTLLGFLGLVVILRLRRIPVPRDPKTLAKFAVMGLFNVAVPWLMITWAETRVNSGSRRCSTARCRSSPRSWRTSPCMTTRSRAAARSG